MRIVLSVLLLLFLLPGYSGDERLPLLEGPRVVRAERIDLYPENPKRRVVGRLRFLGGVELTSPATAFGGFSAMAVRGDRFTLLSDGGNVVRFRMGDDWTPRDIAFGELPDGPGRGWWKGDRDSESMAVDPATGRVWVGFESFNMIWRYTADLSRAEASVAPVAMKDWPENGGAESLVRLRNGKFIVLAERQRAGKGTRAGYVFHRDPVESQAGFAFAYRPPQGYVPVDMAELPDGDLLVLNRAFSFRGGFTATLVRVPRGAVGGGRTAAAVEIARFAGPVIHDNFEALAVTREGGATIVWIASDDNLSMLQRSLLLKFRLLE